MFWDVSKIVVNSKILIVSGWFSKILSQLDKLYSCRHTKVKDSVIHRHSQDATIPSLCSDESGYSECSHNTTIRDCTRLQWCTNGC